jgi:hypothetical protein
MCYKKQFDSALRFGEVDTAVLPWYIYTSVKADRHCTILKDSEAQACGQLRNAGGLNNGHKQNAG